MGYQSAYRINKNITMKQEQTFIETSKFLKH